jgi:hypothetical protein
MRSIIVKDIKNYELTFRKLLIAYSKLETDLESIESSLMTSPADLSLREIFLRINLILVPPTSPSSTV